MMIKNIASTSFCGCACHSHNKYIPKFGINYNNVSFWLTTDSFEPQKETTFSLSNEEIYPTQEDDKFKITGMYGQDINDPTDLRNENDPSSPYYQNKTMKYENSVSNFSDEAYLSDSFL